MQTTSRDATLTQLLEIQHTTLIQNWHSTSKGSFTNTLQLHASQVRNKITTSTLLQNIQHPDKRNKLHSKTTYLYF